MVLARPHKLGLYRIPARRNKSCEKQGMYSKEEVRECPTRKGCYFVSGHTWEVGERYCVHSLLGTGSFSSVCLATDNRTGEKVALKRIPNVLQSAENAKKVLREVCIMRRLSHPNVIALKDAFVRPSETGPCRYQGGRLVPTSIDVYLAMEYASGGDLFNLRGQLSEKEVTSIMWQLLCAVSYLHSQNVWHRDLKSANVLLTLENGVRVVKVADLGSARSASGFDDDHLVEMLTRPKTHEVPPSNGGMEPPLTRQVCTPCYRAPEVVMSRGGYTSSLDMWSVGCIFAELLQRIVYVGSANAPQLQIRPVFTVSGLTATPSDGDRYVNQPSQARTRAELEALFDVIGTPAWACIQAVKSDRWRNYLSNLPLRAGKLHSRFGFAGEAAVDLLGRLLTFDPSRRCTAEEARMHEIFYHLNYLPQTKVHQSDAGVFACDDEPEKSYDEFHADLSRCHSMIALQTDCAPPAKRCRSESPPLSCQSSPTTPLSPARYYMIADPSKALSALESEMFNNSHTDDSCNKLRVMLEGEIDAVSKQNERRRNLEFSAPKVSPRPESCDTCVSMMSGLEEDPVNNWSPEAMGPGRLAQVADYRKSNLDTEKHLYRGRHCEWTETSGRGPAPGPAWGVSCFPPGFDETALDPRVKEIIQSQQMR